MANNRSALPLLAVLGLGLGGCTFDDVSNQLQTSFNGPSGNDTRVAATEAAVRPETLSGPASMPWQLSPASAKSLAQGEMTLVVEKAGLGRIRGTEKALAQLDERVVPYKASGKIVSACKDAFDPQARAAGAYAVEAAASGPERKVPQGYRQQVFFRIFYADPQDNGVEVRQASVACTVGRSGELVAAAAV